MMRKSRFLLWTAGLIALLLIAAVFSLRFGAVNITFSSMVKDLASGDGLVVKYRLPRLLIACMVGCNMAVSGFILQGITRNPLASPDVVGVSAGSGLFAVIILLVFPAAAAGVLPAAAFAGALTAAAIVYLMAYRRGVGIRPVRLALTGVAVSAGFQALITYMIVKYALSSSQALVWLKGSLYARSWQHVELLWPWTVAGLVLVLFNRGNLNTIQLSEETVKGLGMRVQLIRLLLMLAAVALAASSVAVAGTIGFVGLVIPPLAKLISGFDSRKTLPVAALMGATLVVLADLLGRVLHPPLEIPAGIITALIGAPYFIYILLLRKTG
jgi:ABC-type Fe3+-siderophore transport system, permease component